ncbi:MAG: poly(3-hydroxybutyrate) depolymerase [Pseudomonadota bacterium]
MAVRSLPLRFYLPLAIIVLVVGGLFIGLPAWLAITHLHWGDALLSASYDYRGEAPTACPAGPRAKDPDPTELRTPGGIPIRVHTPKNYDPRRLHPLLVVFAPAGLGPTLNERFTGLTHEATAAGFVVAYAGSRGLTQRVIRDLAQVAPAVAHTYCIDLDRLVYTGHSDGGTISSALAFLSDIAPRPTAIIPSAAGIRGEDLARESCPAPLPVMILHGDRDRLFPGFGREAARWWAQCNQCESTPHEENSCLVWSGCREGGETRYCAHPGSHLDWPDRAREIVAFARRAVGKESRP